ncbi:MAG: hypothetical protein P8Y30_06815, partial [candidate division WOR-3 bacterium]
GQLLQTLAVDLDVGLDFVPRLLGLFEFLALSLANMNRVRFQGYIIPVFSVSLYCLAFFYAIF